MKNREQVWVVLSLFCLSFAPSAVACPSYLCPLPSSLLLGLCGSTSLFQVEGEVEIRMSPGPSNRPGWQDVTVPDLEEKMRSFSFLFSPGLFPVVYLASPDTSSPLRAISFVSCGLPCPKRHHLFDPPSCFGFLPLVGGTEVPFACAVQDGEDRQQPQQAGKGIAV